MDSVKHFQLKKYTIIRNALSNDLIETLSQYALFKEDMNPLINDGQVHNAHYGYSDPAMESLLILLQNKIENAINLNLYPTYSYYRVYRNGSILNKHIDRESCEISATVALKYSYSGDPWPIYVDGNPLTLHPGDLAVYRGCEVNHWREELIAPNHDWHVQAFLHYVDQDGPFSDFKFDKREKLGVLNSNNQKKSYIRFKY